MKPLTHCHAMSTKLWFNTAYYSKNIHTIQYSISPHTGLKNLPINDVKRIPNISYLG